MVTTIVWSYIDIKASTSLMSKIFQIEGKKHNSFDMKSCASFLKHKVCWFLFFVYHNQLLSVIDALTPHNATPDCSFAKLKNKHILSVAVVEFGKHTHCYWSETYHGVSIWSTDKFVLFQFKCNIVFSEFVIFQVVMPNKK